MLLSCIILYYPILSYVITAFTLMLLSKFYNVMMILSIENGAIILQLEVFFEEAMKFTTGVLKIIDFIIKFIDFLLKFIDFILKND